MFANTGSPREHLYMSRESGTAWQDLAKLRKGTSQSGDSTGGVLAEGLPTLCLAGPSTLALGFSDGQSE